MKDRISDILFAIWGPVGLVLSVLFVDWLVLDCLLLRAIRDLIIGIGEGSTWGF